MIEFLVQNADLLLSALALLLAGAALLVRLTPTKVDDEIVAKLQAVVEAAKKKDEPKV